MGSLDWRNVADSHLIKERRASVIDVPVADYFQEDYAYYSNQPDNTHDIKVSACTQQQ